MGDIVNMGFNVCRICGAKDGRAGMLIGNEEKGLVFACLNCDDTRKSGEIVIHSNLVRTEEELQKTFAILPLVCGALILIDPTFMHEPEYWNKDTLDHMISKTYKERLVIAGSLLAAEIDRLQYEVIDMMKISALELWNYLGYLDLGGSIEFENWWNEEIEDDYTKSLSQWIK